MRILILLLSVVVSARACGLASATTLVLARVISPQGVVTFDKRVATPVAPGVSLTNFTLQYRRAFGFTNDQSTLFVAAAGSNLLAVTRTQYDAAGRVGLSMDARGAVTGYGYDAGGRRVSVTNYTGFLVSPPETGSLSPANTNGLVTRYAYGHGAWGQA
jgi:YD repeat-containing protein